MVIDHYKFDLRLVLITVLSMAYFHFDPLIGIVSYFAFNLYLQVVKHLELLDNAQEPLFGG